jgi:hypothetical protein
VGDRNYETFLSLLKGQQWTLDSDRELKTAIRETILELRKRYRTVTREDFEHLVLEDWNREQKQSDRIIKRLQVICDRNLESTDKKDDPAPGHISLVVLPKIENTESSDFFQPKPSEGLKKALWEWLDDRRLLATCNHVVEPEYVKVEVWAQLFLKEGAVAQTVREKAANEVKLFFHPLGSGSYWEGNGWLFGRHIRASELYQLLDGIPGVDYVEKVYWESERVIQTELDGDSNVVTQKELRVKNTKDFVAGDTIRLGSNKPEYFAIATVDASKNVLILKNALNQDYESGTKVINVTYISLKNNELVAVKVATSNFTTMERIGNEWRTV